MLGLTVLGTVLTFVPAVAALFVAKKKRRSMFRWFWIALLGPFAFHLLLWMNIGAINVAAWISLNPFDMTGWFASQLEGFATSFLASLVGLCFPTGLLIWLWRTEELEEMEVAPAGKVKQVLGWTSVGLVGSLYAILLLGALDLPRIEVPPEEVSTLASTATSAATPTTDVDITDLVVDTKPEHDSRLQEALDLLASADIPPSVSFLLGLHSYVRFTFGDVASSFYTSRQSSTTVFREDLQTESLPVLATLIVYELLSRDIYVSSSTLWETPQDCVNDFLFMHQTTSEVWGVIGNSIVPGTELGKLFDKIHRAHMNGTLPELVQENFAARCEELVG